MVLHHVSEPSKLLNEAARVSNKVIIIEDVYDSPIQKYLIYITDSIVNLEITGHLHTNNSHNGWKQTFEDLGLKLTNSSINDYIFLFRQATYVLNT